MKDKWLVPYLPIDPADVGRTYDSDVIRINSQSGKGGVGYVLKNYFGMTIPGKMKEDVGYLMKEVSDHRHMELNAEQMYEVFESVYMNPPKTFEIIEFHFQRVTKREEIHVEVTFEKDGEEHLVEGVGNGRLSAVDDAVRKYTGISYRLEEYEEHTLSKDSAASAMSYIGIRKAGECGEKLIWGAAQAPDIITSSVIALTNAVNRMMIDRS